MIVDGCASANCHSQATAAGGWARKGLVPGLTAGDTSQYVYVNPITGVATIYCQLTNKNQLDPGLDTLLIRIFRLYGNMDQPMPASLNTLNPETLSNHDQHQIIQKLQFMKKTIILAAMAFSMTIYFLSSCYKNKEDILAVPRVSFRQEVVPIVTAAPCGCHNTSGATIRAVLFSDPKNNVIFYDAILGRRAYLDTMSRLVGKHPGGGGIEFAPNERDIIKVDRTGRSSTMMVQAVP
ncbi:MAG: hypothetical protein IPJ60_19300 [Sphingobacteriaceae bacterium]|nr:hypothetical protein [Sphingobacteriaceae bacterium]